MLDYFAANIFLQLTNAPAIMLIVCLGIHSKHRDVFVHAFSFMAFNMILGRMLKMAFQIPLPSSLGIDDYAFPSGHMLSAATLYGYIAFAYGHRHIQTACMIILSNIGLALMYFNYHNLYDVSAALCIAFTLIPLYYYAAQKHFIRTLTILILLGISMVLLMPHGQISYTKVQHIWLNLGLLIGIYHAQSLLPHNIKATSPYPLLVIHSLFGGIWYYVGLQIHSSVLPHPCILTLTGYAFTLWVSTSHKRTTINQLLQQIQRPITLLL